MEKNEGYFISEDQFNTIYHFVKALKSDWISVEHNLPLSESDFYLTFSKDGLQGINTGRSIKVGNRYGITHWMPLPNPPFNSSPIFDL